MGQSPSIRQDAINLCEGGLLHTQYPLQSNPADKALTALHSHFPAQPYREGSDRITLDDCPQHVGP